MDPRTGLPRVGMVGGGQLARMTHQAAVALGQTLRVLATDPDDSAAMVTPDVQIGHHTDLEALRTFAAGCEVVTFDHEHVPTEHLRVLTAEGHAVHPGADALQYAQDKALMRVRLAGLGVPVPAFEVLDRADPAALESFADAHGWPVVLKTARGGYDGRGVWMLASTDEAVAAAGELVDAGPLVLEAFVPMVRELAAVVARSPFGQAAAWPVVQTVQQDGICVEVIAPAPGLPPSTAVAAERLALRLAGELGVVGVLAVELFEVDPSADYPDGLLVNELAMRPHNSGHWSMDGSVTSQFEQHLRAVLDYPLGRTDLIAPFTVMANVLGGDDPAGADIGMDERVHHLGARFPEVKVHLYGKGFRPGRKLGHVNVMGKDLDELRRRAMTAAAWLGNGVWPDGYHVHGRQRPGKGICMTGAQRAVGRRGGADHGQRLGLDRDACGRKGSRRLRGALRGRGVLGAPHAATDAGLRLERVGARPAGDHRRCRRGGAPARHGGQRDGAAGDRGAGAAGHPGRAGLAAVHRADAGRDPGRHGLHRRRGQRRPARRADPGDRGRRRVAGRWPENSPPTRTICRRQCSPSTRSCSPTGTADRSAYRCSGGYYDAKLPAGS